MPYQAPPPPKIPKGWFIALAWLFLLIILYSIANPILERQLYPKVQYKNQQGQHEVIIPSNAIHSFHVPGTINDIPVHFVVDTGASIVTVPENVAKKTKLKKGIMHQAQTASDIITVHQTMIKKLQIGSITLYNIRATINPHSHSNDVLLGMSALKHLKVQLKDGYMILSQAQSSY